jgi:hypothetical protein
MRKTFLHLFTAAALLGTGSARAAAPAPAAAPAAQPAADVEALRAELKAVKAKLDALEAAAAKPAVVPASSSVVDMRAVEDRLDLVEVKQGDAVVAGDIPGSFRIPGTEVSLRLYGFAELNWVHDFGADNSDIDYSTFAPYLPLDGKRTNRDYLTGRTSRLGLEAGTPTKYGVLSVKLEGDFNNEPRTGNTGVYYNGEGGEQYIYTQQATNSYGFRVRHLYGQFGGLLVGQTWSTFMDVDNYPETVDFNGPIGSTFIRQPQIRFAYGTKAGTFTAALENSSTYVLDTQSGLALASSLSRMPDFVVRWDKGFEWGAMSVRAMTQELRFDDGAGNEATKRGWGAAASALVKSRGKDFITIGVTGGEGIGRYLNYIEGALYDAPSGSFEVERAVGVIAGYQLRAADWLRVNFVYGATRNFDNDYTDLAKGTGYDSGRWGVNRTVQQAHIGPIFTVVPGVDLGLEAIWAQRETLAGEKGDMTRVNFSAKYYIN